MALRPLNIASLCAGIGGLDLGVKRATAHAARTVVYVEREAYCAEVLAARMGDGIDAAPIYDCIESFDSRAWRGVVDCIIGGYPCQPFSAAGQRRGAQDPRHLWPYFLQHIRAIEPAMVFCENVPGHLTLGFEQVCHDLCGLGYTVEAGIFSAAECGAPHIRKRLFFFAHADSAKLWKQSWRRHGAPGPGEAQPGDDGGQGGLARLSTLQRRPGMDGQAQSGLVGATAGLAPGLDPAGAPWGPGWEDGTPRITRDLLHHSDRLRALGNAVVPATAELAWRTLAAQAGIEPA